MSGAAIVLRQSADDASNLLTVPPFNGRPFIPGEPCMLMDILHTAAEKIFGVLCDISPSIVAMAVVFTVLSLFSAQACNPGCPWWRNRGLVTDVCYLVVIPFIAPYMRMGLIILGAILLFGGIDPAHIEDYVSHGHGPLAGLSFWGQVAVQLLAADFMLYWIHRLFHRGRMWRYHAIHHSSEDVDWTTAYRFHPINLWLGPFFVSVVMLYLGIAPAVLLFLVPVDGVMAVFVHANLKWTFGPLKYVIATPVFHRWHHTPLEQGGGTNFASTFALWDVLFSTFKMPTNALPQRYGVDEPDFPRSFWGQLVYPFRN